MICNKITAFGLSLAVLLGLGTSSQSAHAISQNLPPKTQAAAPMTIVSLDRGPIAGGWTINQGALSLKKHKDAAEAFKKATKGMVGYDQEVVAFLGSQVVAGTNYSYLCKGHVVYPNAQNEYIIVNVYEDLQGHATITGSRQVLPVARDMATGAWSYNQGNTDVKKHKEVKKAYDKAAKSIADGRVSPVAYLGSQVVAGSNYAILVAVTPNKASYERYFAILTIYNDLHGQSSLIKAEALDIGLN